MKLDKHFLEDFFSGLRSKKILVIGDVMLDTYQWGKVGRISPEAPVPVVELERVESRPGGAANVGLNLVQLGAKAQLLAVVGNDDAGSQLKHHIRLSGVGSNGLIVSDYRPTTVKTRIMAGSQQLLRVDREQNQDLTAEELEPLLDWFNKHIEEFDAVILQDYDKGVLTTAFIEHILAKCITFGIPTAVDPKKRHFGDFKNASLIKPNLKELKEGLGIDIRSSDLSSVNAGARRLLESLNSSQVLITLSEYGVFYLDKNESGHFPAHLRTIADVSGAGDTVISVAACCLAMGTPLSFLAFISNLAGGIVCESLGVVPVESAKLLEEARLYLPNTL